MLFTAPDTWTGGEYELYMVLGCRSDDEVAAALTALWSHPSLDGPYARDDVEPSEQQPARVLDHNVLYGVARLPDGSPVACMSFTGRFEGEGAVISLGIPMGALVRAWPHVGGYPFVGEDDPATFPWQRELDEWLGGVGLDVAESSGFEIGFVGWDAGALFGFVFELEVDGLGDFRRGGVPDERPLGLVWRDPEGRVNWHPATAGGGFAI